jgi:hypothetical protein
MLEPKKIVYLFGAGATHAEKMHVCPSHDDELSKDEGLTNEHVSRRVMEEMWKNKVETSDFVSRYRLDEKCLTRPPGVTKNVDIEFLITLIESNKTKTSEEDSRLVRKYFRRDITNKLNYKGEKITPFLYLALLEWQKSKTNEIVLGHLTLNYDTLFEDALAGMDYDINRGLSIGNCSRRTNHEERLLLKLHGSFDWILNGGANKIRIAENYGEEEEPQWIPPGLIKEYVNYPYNLLFGRAREILVECDVLRLIGCSLSQNDWGLISLIFGTQKLRSDDGYRIEIVDSPEAYKDIQNRLGFYLKFEELFYGSDRYKELFGDKRTKNSFFDWLFFNSKNMGEEELNKTQNLKSLANKVT